MKTLVTTVLSLLLHLLIGWAWTPLAGLAGGLWAGKRGWMVGAVGVGLGWALLIVWNFAANRYGAFTFLGTMGGVLGNLPGILLVVLTLLIGALLGLLSGAAGQHLARYIRRQPTPVRA